MSRPVTGYDDTRKGTALTLLLVINLNLWITLLFPAWVFLISIYNLVADARRPAIGAAPS